jgi:abelson tyrosine-protein kinase 1
VDERFQPVAAPSLSSFKQRAPAPTMGGRAVEQRRQEDRRSRSKGTFVAGGAGGGEKSSRGGGSSSKTDRRVGQLDERNLKRAAHRYGTLPKGARIGAYLESLRASGLTPEPVFSDGESGHDTLDSQRSGHTDPGPGGGRAVGSVDPPLAGGPLLLHPAQPPGMMNMMMARSNSSHGGFPGATSSAGGHHSSHGGHQSRPSGPRSGQLPRRLPTYTQGSAPLRGSAGGGGKTSALLDLDFPPPPADQPEDITLSSPASSFHPLGGYSHHQQQPHQQFLPSSPSPQQRLLRGCREQSPDSCSSVRSEQMGGTPRSDPASSPLPLLQEEEDRRPAVPPSFTTFSHQQQQLVSEIMVGGSTPPLPASSPLPPPIDQVHFMQC